MVHFLLSVTSSESNYTFMNEMALYATTKKRLGSDEGSRVISAQVNPKELFVFIITLEISTRLCLNGTT